MDEEEWEAYVEKIERSIVGVETARTLALRTSLRLLPFASKFSGSSAPQRILNVLQLNHLAWIIQVNGKSKPRKLWEEGLWATRIRSEAFGITAADARASATAAVTCLLRDGPDSKSAALEAIDTRQSLMSFTGPTDFPYKGLVARTEVFQAALDDAEGLNSLRVTPRRMTDSPLWGTISEPPEINEAWFQLSSYFSKDLNSWGFWKRWYEKVLAGELSDLDIEICTRVAQIPSEIWDAKENAPQKVAAEIAKIEAQFEVRELARATKASVLEAAVQARAEARRHGIGGNLPPEQIEDLQIPTALTIIYESAQTLEEEAEKDEPDVTLVVQAVDALTTVTKWIAGHMDAAIGAAVKAVGTAGGAAIVAWLSGHGDKVTKLLEAAQQWLLAL